MSSTHTAGSGKSGSIEYVTFRVDAQWLGIPVLMVQEVLLAQRIADVPLAPAEVAGFLNLRGQIVTALDLRTRLGIPSADRAQQMNVVVRHDSELFSLLVDEVGDVLSVDAAAVESAPQTLHPTWRHVCSGIVRRDRDLLVVINVDTLIRVDVAAA